MEMPLGRSNLTSEFGAGHTPMTHRREPRSGACSRAWRRQPLLRLLKQHPTQASLEEGAARQCVCVCVCVCVWVCVFVCMYICACGGRGR